LNGIVEALKTDTKKGLTQEINLVTEGNHTQEVPFGRRKEK